MRTWTGVSKRCETGTGPGSRSSAPVALGDMVVLDVEGSAEGKTILDRKDVNYVVSEDGNPALPGFSENLVGLEVDTPGEFVLSIPEDNPDTQVAGKEASFRVTMKEIKERRLPDLDDEFAEGGRGRL